MTGVEVAFTCAPLRDPSEPEQILLDCFFELLKHKLFSNLVRFCREHLVDSEGFKLRDCQLPRESLIELSEETIRDCAGIVKRVMSIVDRDFRKDVRKVFRKIKLLKNGAKMSIVLKNEKLKVTIPLVEIKFA